MAALPDLLRRAIPVETRDDDATPPLKRVHRLFAPMRLNGTTCTVRLTVKELDRKGVLGIDGLKIFKGYDVALEKRLPAGSSDQLPEGSDRPSAGSSDVRTLLEGVNDDDGKPYFQRTRGRGAKGPRGSITFVPGRPGFRSIMRLFGGADLSTVLHESGHYFFEVLGHLATTPGLRETVAPVLAGDFKVLLEAAGLDAGDGSAEALAKARAEVGTVHHEKIARLFEAYVMEGKAPSLPLARVFERMAAWLLGIYRTVAGLDVELTPEVRAVFDRMLATDRAMALAAERTEADPVLVTASEGMSAAEHSTYLERHRAAMAQAKRALVGETMRDLRVERTAEYREARDALRPVIEAEVRRRPTRMCPRPLRPPMSWRMRHPATN